MRHIVGLSGGKDSTAMTVRLKELYPEKEWIYICTPTGDELPEMEAHWQRLENILGQEIIKVKHPNPEYKDLKSCIEKENMLPNFRRRFCTRILKIEVAENFYSYHPEASVYVGLRADEQERKGRKKEIETDIHPLKEWGWGLKEVWGYLREKKITIPKRTDCARCFFQRIDEWWTLWKDYPEIFADAEAMEEKIGHTFLTPGKSGNTWHHSLKELRKQFESGKTPRKAPVYYPLFNSDNDFSRCRICTL